MARGQLVVHLGWMARPVEALLRAGAEVVCVIAPKDLPAVRAAQVDRPGLRLIVVPSPHDVEAVLAGLARTQLARSEIDRVCSGMEFCLVPAAAISDLFGLTSETWPRLLGMRDKTVQKALVRQVGVPAAGCTVLDTLADVPAAATFPSVLKPLNGGGAAHTHLVHGPADLEPVLTAAAAGGPGPWLLEEYIEGREYQVDGLIRDGRITVLCISRYLQNLIEVHQGGLVAHVALSPHRHRDLYARVRALAERSFKALNYEGAFHLEVFDHPDQIVFGECAARVGGGRTDDVVTGALGVDLRDEWARLILGLPSLVPADLSPPQEQEVFGGMNLPGPAGVITGMPCLADVLGRPGVIQAELDVALGGTMPDVTKASHLRAGLAVVTGRDEEETEARMRDLAAWFGESITVEPPAC